MASQPARRWNVAVVGASTLRGKDLVQLLEERPLPLDGMRLFDDVAGAGTLTEAAGEPAFIQPLDEDSFRGVDLAFFACEENFAVQHWPAAERAGAAVIDLSGALSTVRSAVPWIPALDALLPPPRPPVAPLYNSPGAATIVACTIAAAMARFPVRRVAAVFFQPVSERGQAGIEELESQTAKLLSFQPIAKDVFDTQVAFNLLDRFGEASREHLDDIRASVARDVALYLAGRLPVPAVQLIQAPVFYSFAFSVYLELDAPRETAELERALEAAGVKLAAAGEPSPSNVSVAGNQEVSVARLSRDPNVECGYWLWGAVDNVRLAAHNAVRIAEKILAAV